MDIAYGQALMFLLLSCFSFSCDFLLPFAPTFPGILLFFSFALPVLIMVVCRVSEEIPKNVAASCMVGRGWRCR